MEPTEFKYAWESVWGQRSFRVVPCKAMHPSAICVVLTRWCRALPSGNRTCGLGQAREQRAARDVQKSQLVDDLGLGQCRDRQCEVFVDGVRQ